MSVDLNRRSAKVASARPLRMIQFGDGNFLRGFVDWFVDELNTKGSFDGDVVVIAPLRRSQARTKDSQDGLYHLVLNGLVDGKPDTQTKLITCIAKQIDPYREFDTFLSTSSNADIRFLTSNSTEAGIVFSPADDRVDRPADNFPAKVAQWLFARFQHFGGSAESGVYVVPCELIADNATALQEVILEYARHWSLPSTFNEWIVEHNVFCNTLVDRIVTGYPKDNASAYEKATGYIDHKVVVAEPYALWAIEKKGKIAAEFPADKFALPVVFTDDVSTYRTQKVRILNGAHTAMVALGYLRGLRTVLEVMEDPTMHAFVETTIREEIIPTLTPSGQDLHSFASAVIDRFRNPFIRHELASIILNSISKFKVRVLPSMLAFQRLTGTLPDNIILSLAALLTFYKGSWKGADLPVKDDPKMIDFFDCAWQHDNATAIRLLLSNKAIWGEDLTLIPGIEPALLQAMTRI